MGSTILNEELMRNQQKCPSPALRTSGLGPLSRRLVHSIFCRIRSKNVYFPFLAPLGEHCLTLSVLPHAFWMAFPHCPLPILLFRCTIASMNLARRNAWNDESAANVVDISRCVKPNAQNQNRRSQICRSLTPLKSPPIGLAHSARPPKNDPRADFVSFRKQ